MLSLCVLRDCCKWYNEAGTENTDLENTPTLTGITWQYKWIPKENTTDKQRQRSTREYKRRCGCHLRHEARSSIAPLLHSYVAEGSGPSATDNIPELREIRRAMKVRVPSDAQDARGCCAVTALACRGGTTDPSYAKRRERQKCGCHLERETH